MGQFHIAYLKTLGRRRRVVDICDITDYGEYRVYQVGYTGTLGCHKFVATIRQVAMLADRGEVSRIEFEFASFG